MEEQITIQQLIREVSKMRQAQIAFFKTRNRESLDESRLRERNVDNLMRNFVITADHVIFQPSLFLP